MVNFVGGENTFGKICNFVHLSDFVSVCLFVKHFHITHLTPSAYSPALFLTLSFSSLRILWKVNKKVFPIFRENSGFSRIAHQFPPIYSRCPIEWYQTLQDQSAFSWRNNCKIRSDKAIYKKSDFGGLSCPREGSWIPSYAYRLKGLWKTYPTVCYMSGFNCHTSDARQKSKIFNFCESKQLRFAGSWII